MTCTSTCQARAGIRRGTARAGRDRVLLTRVRHHRGAAAVLGRAGHPGRRSSQGGERSRRPDDRRGPALPARVLHPVTVPGGLAGGAVPVDRPERAAAGRAARRGRRARPRHGGAAPAAASWPRRSGWPRSGRVPLLLLDSYVEDNEPELREVTDRLYGGGQRAPAPAGAAARHRRRSGGQGLLLDHRPPRARGLPHQRGPCGFPGPGADPRATPARASASTRRWRPAARARCSPPTPRCRPASTGSRVSCWARSSAATSGCGAAGASGCSRSARRPIRAAIPACSTWP